MQQAALAWMPSRALRQALSWPGSRPHGHAAPLTLPLALADGGGALAKSDPESLFLWLDLDSPRDSTAITEMLYERGIGVVSSDVFMIGKTKPSNGIRIHKGSARSDTG